MKRERQHKGKGFWVVSLVFGLLGLYASMAFSMPSSTSGGAKMACKEYHFNQMVRVFNYPFIYVPSLALQYHDDPAFGWKELRRQNPIRAELKGTVYMEVEEKPSPFKQFKEVARIFEMVDSRLGFRSSQVKGTGEEEDQNPVMIRMVHLCPPNEGWGFVVEIDFQAGLALNSKDGLLPPSTKSIPELKD